MIEADSSPTTSAKAHLTAIQERSLEQFAEQLIAYASTQTSFSEEAKQYARAAITFAQRDAATMEVAEAAAVLAPVSRLYDSYRAQKETGLIDFMNENPDIRERIEASRLLADLNRATKDFKRTSAINRNQERHAR